MSEALEEQRPGGLHADSGDHRHLPRGAGVEVPRHELSSLQTAEITRRKSQVAREHRAHFR
ncbi:MAG: hypothetical protein DMF90_15160 [Acidobacteria bacterium]|nr:MAG: hypothetical protein DMF90_15160 [Acidobacteriota bacterium]